MQKAIPTSAESMPKQVAINRPVFEMHLNLSPTYYIEVKSMRTGQLKTISAQLEQKRVGDGRFNLEVLTAPKGYRISRIWKGEINSESEIHLTN